jgi:hypothetical protein
VPGHDALFEGGDDAVGDLLLDVTLVGLGLAAAALGGRSWIEVYQIESLLGLIRRLESVHQVKDLVEPLALGRLKLRESHLVEVLELKA